MELSRLANVYRTRKHYSRPELQLKRNDKTRTTLRMSVYELNLTATVKKTIIYDWK